MTFIEVKKKHQDQIETMLLTSYLFVASIDKDLLWNLYLETFPPEYNGMFRERRFHDCNCCRRFIQQFGAVVAVNNQYDLVTMWDIEDAGEYTDSFRLMSSAIKKSLIGDIFVTSEKNMGVDTTPDTHNKDTIWNHYYYKTPREYRNTSQSSNEELRGKARTKYQTLKRAFEELTPESVDLVLELIASNSLHRGAEAKGLVEAFQNKQALYLHILDEHDAQTADNFTWTEMIVSSPALCGIRNSSIGTLLVDLSAGRDINEAVASYEDKVSGGNYKRPKPIFTPAMRQKAQKKIEDMGFGDSLHRRRAVLGDITAENTLFVDRTVKSVIGSDDPFDALEKKETKNKPSLRGMNDITIEDFIVKVLPKIQSMSVLFDGRLEANLVSLIAPERDSKSMFKWNNNFSWAYKGNVADSMKQRVKSLGGDVTGDLRFSIQWNENNNNKDDLDAHCYFPGYHIDFHKKGQWHGGGILDVDIITPGNQIAVENITFPDRRKMVEGSYLFKVHCYSRKGGSGGFTAEIEFDGEIYEFSYPHAMKQNQEVTVAAVRWLDGKFSLVKGDLDPSNSSREIWGISTNSFVPVNIMMLSPNYWDGQEAGNKQYLFMLADCISDEQPNGFYNEFLNQELNEDRKVMQALGDIMRVADSENALNGLGFSATKRNKLIVKVEGTLNRMFQITF